MGLLLMYGDMGLILRLWHCYWGVIHDCIGYNSMWGYGDYGGYVEVMGVMWRLWGLIWMYGSYGVSFGVMALLLGCYYV